MVAGMIQQLAYEDVSEGMEVPPSTVGPITSIDTMRFTTAVDQFSMLHVYQKWMRERGYKDVLLNGPLKQALLISWLDSWIGEDGFVKKLSCQHRGMDYHNNTLTLAGTITKTYEIDGFGYVDCEIAVRNQNDEVTCPGTATLVLPKRGGPPAPLAYDPPAEYRELLERLLSGAERIIDPPPMPDGMQLVTLEAWNLIGVVGETFAWPEPIDHTLIRRFTDATFERKRIYIDEAYAKASRYGALTAPPAYVLRPPFDERGMIGESAVPHVSLPAATRGMNGGNDAEWFRPVRLGDTITQRAYLAALPERTARSGPMAIVTGETIFTNQRDEIVARSRQANLRLA